MRFAGSAEFQDRWRDWIRLSHAASMGDIAVAIVTQELGRLDAELMVEGPHVVRAFQSSAARPELEGQQMSDHITFSALWTLGAYELIRTLEERVRGGAPQTLLGAKDQLRRVRVPLAKLQPARPHLATDWGWPGSIADESRGIGWLVAPETPIFRKDLSELTRAALSSIAALPKAVRVPDADGGSRPEA